MESVDPEVVRRQLQENYEQMTEDELNVVAEDAYDLTDLAREMLQAEIARRDLNIELKTPPLPTHTLDDDLIRRTVFELARGKPEDDISFNVLCPECHSPEIVFQGRQTEATDNPETAKDMLEENSSPADAKFNWSCDACGYQWQDDGIE